VLKGFTLALVALTVLSLLLGVGLTLCPSAAADIAVGILLLNSYSGVAAARARFRGWAVKLLIHGWRHGGAPGLILTQVMCTAIETARFNLRALRWRPRSGRPPTGLQRSKDTYTQCHLLAARGGALTPRGRRAGRVRAGGSMLAVAQAQHQPQELGRLAGNNTASPSLRIHPVGGRMPGHMNVLAGRGRCAPTTS